MDELKQLRMIKQKSYRFGFYHIFVMNKDGVGFYIDENVHRDQKEEDFFQDVMNNDVFITAPFSTITFLPSIELFTVPSILQPLVM